MNEDREDKDFMQEKWGVNNCDDVGEILSCPFCGSNNLNVYYNAVQCVECRAFGPTEQSRELAIAAWNNCKR